MTSRAGFAGTAGLVLAAHLAGCFPSARLVGRAAGFDPTTAGSGNPGATNALRLGGRKAGAAVLALDLAKGAAPAAIGLGLGGRRLGLLLGAAAVSGHVLPATRGFRSGGKGVATAGGVVLVVDPALAGAAAAAFGAIGGLTRRASAGSVVAAAIVPIGAAAARRAPVEVGGWAAIAALVVARHRSNLRRLAAGTEPETLPADG